MNKAQREIVKESIDLAIRLGETPANLLTPADLAAECVGLHKDIKTHTLGEMTMKELNMGLLLGVSQGSDEEAKLIIMEYNSPYADGPPIALVGKGLTFDAGGYSLKPSKGMHQMKMDMLGGGSVIAAMKAIADLELPINVVGVVPSSENLVNGKATKPGDVHTAANGLKVEVLNTDAEGRLILADALTYVQDEYDPVEIIDVATLTGAALYALGSYYTCVLSNNAKMAKAVVKSGKRAKDLAWHLPMHKDVHKEIECEGDYADLKNIAEKPGPGTTTAAAFLARFIQDDTPWVHLDVAATASDGDTVTGRPVRLLVQYIIDKCN
jgi:leucyl aminopeptidase